MRVNIIKSYCAHMFRVLKQFLLFFLVFQVGMMPVSQAFAARHMHDISHDASHETMMTSVFLSSAMVTKFQHVIKFNRKDGWSGMTHVSPQSQKTHLQSSRCGKKNGHKGDCDSCQCMPTVATPVLMQVISVFTPTESYSVKLVYPLYNVIMPPPLRPPTS